MRAEVRQAGTTDVDDSVFGATSKMDDYTRDELVDTIRSATRKGCNYERDEIVAAVATYLGFVRITDGVRDPIKSAINAAIRRGVLGYEGSTVWRED